MAADTTLIRAKTRLQNQAEPSKQRPILSFDPYNSQHQAADSTSSIIQIHTIRPSIDSGHDNPFRPDGEIYRATDPIVDYYKLAANQSRPQSPSDSHSLLKASEKARKKFKKQQQRGNKSAGNGLALADKDEANRRRRSCWRKWCCCCFCKRNDTVEVREIKSESHATRLQYEDNLTAQTGGQIPELAAPELIGGAQTKDMEISQETQPTTGANVDYNQLLADEAKLIAERLEDLQRQQQRQQEQKSTWLLTNSHLSMAATPIDEAQQSADGTKETTKKKQKEKQSGAKSRCAIS